MVLPHYGWQVLLPRRFLPIRFIRSMNNQDFFFRCSTQRMFNSMIYALQKDGPADDFAILRDAGLESIRQDLKGSLLRYLEHLVTVLDYRDRKPSKSVICAILHALSCVRGQSIIRVTLRKVCRCQPKATCFRQCRYSPRTREGGMKIGLDCNAR